MKDIINSLIESMVDSCDFSEELTSENFDYNVVEKLEENTNIYFHAEHGATKGVIVPLEGDYVIKIPFSGEYYEYEDEVVLFDNASAMLDIVDEKLAVSEWDYCEVECQYYSLAKQYHVENLFVKTEFYGEICGYPIYIQPKVRVFCNSKDSKKYNSAEGEKITKNAIDFAFECQGYVFNKFWLADFINYYGEETLKKLFNFINAYELHDFHNSNIGYLGDRPIIFDYSGFND